MHVQRVTEVEFLSIERHKSEGQIPVMKEEEIKSEIQYGIRARQMIMSDLASNVEIDCECMTLQMELSNEVLATKGEPIHAEEWLSD